LTVWKQLMKTFLCIGLMALSMTGCGELSYKRGASAQDLEATRKSCQSAGTEKAVEKCLEDNGWVVKKLDDIELFATASVTDDNRNLGTSEPAKGADKPAPGTVARSPAMPGTTAAAGSGGAPVASPAPPPAPPASPLDVYKISSWWKLGAGREAMEADTADCVAQLGSAHKPDNATQQVTRGFVVCMHGKGWKALREK